MWRVYAPRDNESISIGQVRREVSGAAAIRSPRASIFSAWSPNEPPTRTVTTAHPRDLLAARPPIGFGFSALPRRLPDGRERAVPAVRAASGSSADPPGRDRPRGRLTQSREGSP